MQQKSIPKVFFCCFRRFRKKDCYLVKIAILFWESAPKRYKTIERPHKRYRLYNSTNPALSVREIHAINDLTGVFTDTRKLEFTYLCWEGNKRIGQFLTDAV